MKNKKSAIVIPLCMLLFIVAISCGNSNKFIIGKWTITATGTEDTTLGFYSAFSHGAEFNFGKDSSYSITDHGKSILYGKYIVSDDGKMLTLKSNNEEYVYEVVNDADGMTITAIKNKAYIKMKK